MGKTIAWLLACALLLDPRTTLAEPGNKPGLARQLLQGCLAPPTQQVTSNLASVVGALPYSKVRRLRGLRSDTITFEEPAPSHDDQRTKTTVTEFRGWDLQGQGAGTLEYQEQRTETVWVDHATQKAVTPFRAALSRSCKLNAPVANARAILELYEGLNPGPYGIRISANRRWIDFYAFDEDRFDIELSFDLRSPLAGMVPDAAKQEGHINLSDGRPMYFSAESPGIPTLILTHGALLTGLDQTATVHLLNEDIQPIIHRLAAAR
jgi:hypothetical protein